MNTVFYHVTNNGTIKAQAKFRCPLYLMEKVKSFFLSKKSASVLVTTLIQKLSKTLDNGNTIFVYTPKSKLVTYEFNSNPLEFQNGSFVADQGNGWYTAFGDGETINSCFVALNAVLHQLHKIINPNLKSERSTYYTKAFGPRTKKFQYFSYPRQNVPVEKQWDFKQDTLKKFTLKDLENKYGKHSEKGKELTFA